MLIAMSYSVVIDNREKYSRKNNALKFFKSKQDYVRIEELQIGDFLFNDTVVFEYKNLSDFVKSVKNGRVFNQAKDQSLVFDYHFVIIVSTSYERRKYFNKLKYSGQSKLYFDNRYFYTAIAMLNTFTTVLQVPDEHMAFEVMRLQTKKCLENRHIYKNLKGKTNNPAFNLLLNIKNVDESIAEEIVSTLNLYSFSDLVPLKKEDFLNVPSVDNKLSEVIVKAINNF